MWSLRFTTNKNDPHEIKTNKNDPHEIKTKQKRFTWKKNKTKTIHMKKKTKQKRFTSNEQSRRTKLIDWDISPFQRLSIFIDVFENNTLCMQ
jgi:hypothetical protein